VSPPLLTPEPLDFFEMLLPPPAAYDEEPDDDDDVAGADVDEVDPLVFSSPRLLFLKRFII